LFARLLVELEHALRYLPASRSKRTGTQALGIESVHENAYEERTKAEVLEALREARYSIDLVGVTLETYITSHPPGFKEAIVSLTGRPRTRLGVFLLDPHSSGASAVAQREGTSTEGLKKLIEHTVSRVHEWVGEQDNVEVVLYSRDEPLLRLVAIDVDQLESPTCAIFLGSYKRHPRDEHEAPLLIKLVPSGETRALFDAAREILRAYRA
jgi:hypothetical protein